MKVHEIQAYVFGYLCMSVNIMLALNVTKIVYVQYRDGLKSGPGLLKQGQGKISRNLGIAF